MTAVRALAIELDAIGDTRPLWSAWLESARGVLEIDPAELSMDRGDAADALDRAAAGNWRTLLERFAADRAPVYLRPAADVSAALRALQAAGARLAVFTDAPEELARLALSQLGADRRVESLHAGADAEARALASLGSGAEVVQTRADLLAGLPPR